MVAAKETSTFEEIARVEEKERSVEASRVSLQIGRLIGSGKLGTGRDGGGIARIVGVTAEEPVSEGSGQSGGGSGRQHEGREDQCREEDQKVAGQKLLR